MIKKIYTKVATFFKSLFQNTLNHYNCYLPRRSSPFISMIFNYIFSKIDVDERQLEALNELKKDGNIIVYATKYKSHFAFLFYHTRFQKEGVPFPGLGFTFNFYKWQPISRLIKIFISKIIFFLRHFKFPDPFETGYIEEELLNGKSALMALVGKKAFYERFVKAKTDPLEYLIEIQKKTDKDIYVVPLLMFFSMRPDHSTPTLIDLLFGSKERPGKFRRLLTIFQHPGKAFAEVSEPVSVRQFITYADNKTINSAEQALRLRRHLVLLTNRHRHTVTGPILKSREEIKENILTCDSLRPYLEEYAKESGETLHETRKEADALLEEIASNFSMNWIKAYDVVVTWLKNNMFDEMIVDVEGLRKIKEASKNAPLILVPCHKSHLDYLMISYALHKNNMPCPHIAAGKNLSFWPLGTIFRGGGAFFIRRTFKGQPFYARIFFEYVKKLLLEGFNIEFYIEGGRSRTGKVLSPKFGMLSIILNALKEGACKDLIFAPIFIGYDRVMEESSYLHEVEGGEKKAESIKEMIKARKFITKKYGKIYINIHDPISLNDYLKKRGKTLNEITDGEPHEKLCRDLAFKFIDSINKASVVTPHAVVASTILNAFHSEVPFSYKALAYHMGIYLRYLTEQNANLADTLKTDSERALRLALENYIQRKFIDADISDSDDITPQSEFKINTKKRAGLDYYKNNSISFFINGAYTAFAILEADKNPFSTSDLHDTFKFLQDFFNLEFAPDTEFTALYIIRKNLKSFINQEIIIPHRSLPDTYNISVQGKQYLVFFANFLKTYFESYKVALQFLKKYREDEFDYKGRLKKIQSMATAKVKKNSIEHPESISKINYGNALNFFEEKGITGSQDYDKIQYYLDKIQKSLNALSSYVN